MNINNIQDENTMTDIIPLHTRQSVIKKQPCFSPLKDQEIEMLATLLIPKEFKAGETIVNEGDSVDSFYLLVQGEAEVRQIIYNDKTPEVKAVAVLSADRHDAIGLNETGFYSLSGLRTATVVAKTDVVALYLTLALFHGFALYYSHVNEVMRKQSRNYVNMKRVNQ